MGKKRCEVHKGPKGGRYYMERVKGKKGTQRRYLAKGEQPPIKE